MLASESWSSTTSWQSRSPCCELRGELGREERVQISFACLVRSGAAEVVDDLGDGLLVAVEVVGGLVRRLARAAGQDDGGQDGEDGGARESHGREPIYTALVNRPASIPRGRHAPPLEVRLEVQRERLLDAAAAVFAEQGYAKATAEAISREAGMSKATFYEHFANKEDVHPRAVRRVRRAARCSAMAQATGQVAEEPERADPRRRARVPARRSPRTRGAPQTLLVEIIGAGPRAVERRDAMLERFAALVEAENAAARAQARHAALPLAARRVRDRRRDGRAVLAPAAPRRARGPR